MVGETLLDGLRLAGEIGWQFVLADYVAGLVLIAFTLVLLGQLRRLLGDERRTSDGPRHAHRMTTGRSHRDRYH